MNQKERTEYILKLEKENTERMFKYEMDSLKRKSRQNLCNLQISLISLQMQQASLAVIYQAFNPNIRD